MSYLRFAILVLESEGSKNMLEHANHTSNIEAAVDHILLIMPKSK